MAATTLPIAAFPSGATRITGSAALSAEDASNAANQLLIEGFASVDGGQTFPFTASTTWTGGLDPETGEPIQPMFSVWITPADAAFLTHYYTAWTPNGPFDFAPAMEAA